MLEDCFEYYKGCQDCQKFGNIQRVPASALNPIIKPWPFRGWGIDLIGQINPPSSKGHKFEFLATDYFTKWVEAIPLKKVTSENMIEFVKEHIIYRFGIPQTITTDQGTQFTSSEFRDFAESMWIKLLNSSPYYAQANGQEEASNKIMIKIIHNKIDQKPRRWHWYSMKLCGLTEWLLMELSGIHPGYSCKGGGSVEDKLLVEFPCTPTRTRSM
jgi:hypothetical protein